MRQYRTGLFIAAGFAAAACHPKPLKDALQPGSDGRPMQTVSRLACPGRSGDLTRTAQAADGQTCGYAGPDGENVSLQLLSLAGAPAADRLATIETRLQADLPAAAPARHGTGVYIAGGDKGGDQAHIDLPGFHLTATGDKADIRMPGVSINANGDDAHVHTGLAQSVTVSAHSGGAEIRTGGSGPKGTFTRYLLASDAPSAAGFRAEGYLAKGPAAGPLVVAVFRLRDHQNGVNVGAGGVDALVDQNVHR